MVVLVRAREVFKQIFPLLLHQRRDLSNLMILHILLLLLEKDQIEAIVPIVEITVINCVVLLLLLAKDHTQVQVVLQVLLAEKAVVVRVGPHLFI